MTNLPIREQPLTKYRISITNGNNRGETLYCDDRDEAIKIAHELGGRAEVFYNGEWQLVLKVLP